MKEDANAHYMLVLDALGAQIEKNKSDLALAQYEKQKLEEKLKAAEYEIASLKGTIPPKGAKETR